MRYGLHAFAQIGAGVKGQIDGLIAPILGFKASGYRALADNLPKNTNGRLLNLVRLRDIKTRPANIGIYAANLL